MRTKTNFQAVQELLANFQPAQRGIITDPEAAQVRSILELDARDDLELDDIRDMAVAVYGQTADSRQTAMGIGAMMATMDAMSAVTAVIDGEKSARQQPGMAVTRYALPPRYAVATNGNTEFLRAAGTPAFSKDPADARKWARRQDAEAMAGYAVKQYRRPMSVVRIDTCRTVLPVRGANIQGGGAPDAED